ncbi:MocR-like pyridoxine biosynthesis transcription factor PdxR [Azospirillum rugosum]|uniref:GntR family transcriptional regulator/MocR family aminotransferase n=1 Tax=Azospirillum rugosum TaxID=416170 RepID=A0ABS4SJT1_9PROT|nr:PLP-dependent aminotransferase family protein [Azospirillum rugosum]MBP2292760.1 GntR family transcriptional regulator/MocR family aminotransferase [Azospirillum rugosum]MDQ0527019.1 GntR family transcriptional regulator/MocR family aminotransferase [Azospirillum rugosum]
MARRSRPVLAGLGPIPLDRGAEGPLYQQLYKALRQAILDGRMKPGARMLATRVAAQEWAVSRNTVVTAYEQLLTEGYVTGRVGAGTYVATALPDPPPIGSADGTGGTRGVSLSRRGAALATPFHPCTPAKRPFSLGIPDPEGFPFALWSKLLAQPWRVGGRSLAVSADPLGYPPLRAVIADYLRAMRAVRCEPEQVVILSGAQQALALMAQLLLDPGDPVWMEDPGWPGTRSALAGAGARIVPVPVDGEGIDVAEGERRAPDARMALVTPSHQFPLGVTMSLRRRAALLDWAVARDAWIVEDDYDSEFRYAGPPLAALQGLDEAGRVLYIGSFSKVMFPTLRLGYLVVPPDLVDAVCAGRRHFDGGTSVVPQAALHRFIAEEHFASHLRAMRALYAERRDALLDALRRHIEPVTRIDGGEAGLHVVAHLDERHRDVEVAARAARLGLSCPPLSGYYAEPTAANGLVLGFAAHPAETLAAAVRGLAGVFAASP